MSIRWNAEELTEKDSAGVTDDSRDDFSGGLKQGYELGSLTDGLVAYFPFDGSVEDKALSHSVTDNTSADFFPGQIGQAKEFDGDDDYLRSPPLIKGDTMTVATWIYINSEPEPFSQIIHPKDATTTFTMFRESSNNRLLFRTGDGSGNKTDLYSSDNSLPTGSWVHVVATVKNETEQNIFINGTLHASGTSSYPFTGNGTVEQDIGYQQANTKYPLSGRLDDFRVYDRALSKPEIQELYQRTSTQKISDRDRLTSGLIGHWPLNEDNAGTAYDLSGNGNDSSSVTGTSVVPGLGGAKARSFDGDDDYIECPDNDIIADKGPLTFSAFIRRSSTGSQHTIVEDNPTGGRILWFEVNSSDQLEVGLYDGSSAHTATSSSTLSADGWYHVAGIYDPGDDNLYVYIDGTQEGSNTGISDANHQSSSWGISHNNHSFDGVISDVRIYRRILSQNEIKALARLGGVDVS